MANNFSETPPHLKFHVKQYRLFESAYDIEEMNYNDISWILHDYIESFLNGKGVISKLNISPKIEKKVRFYLVKMEEYLRNQITDAELNALCNANLEEIMEKEREAECHENDLTLLSIIKYGLFNRSRSALDDDDASYLIGFIFSDIGKLGNEYCKKFREYIEKHPRMQKFKITPSAESVN